MSARPWRELFKDISDACRRIQEFTDGFDAAQFHEDKRTQDAVTWNLTTIGEAARLIPPEIQERYPKVPWPQMRGMRNIVVHEYFGIDLAIVWDTATRNIPALESQILDILNELDEPSC